MDNFCLGGKGIELSGDSIIKPGTNRDKQVALGHRHVGCIGAVHAEHTHGQFMVTGKCPKSHQGHGDRNIQFGGQFREFFSTIGKNHSTADIEYRFPGFHDKPAGFVHLSHLGFDIGLIAHHANRFSLLEIDGAVDNVLGQIHEHRPGSSGPGHVKCLTHDINQFVLAVDQIVMLGAGSGNADNVHFLKSVVTDQRGGYLAGEDNDWDRVHIGGGNSGNSVGCTGSGGQKSDTHFP